MKDEKEETIGQETGLPSETAEDSGVWQQALSAEKEKAESYLASWQRAQADFINYKKRNEQEKGELSSIIRANTFYAILPVLDDLERALESVPPELMENSWLEGIKLIVRNFYAILEMQGVKPIKALGEPFDPRFHEAVRQDKGKEGIVIAEIQKGYMLNEILIRPSMVVVGNGQEA